MTQIMTTEHPQWEEFCERLDSVLWESPFETDTDKPLATAILKAMSNGGDADFDIPASLAYFETCGGFCDCEILLNVAD